MLIYDYLFTAINITMIYTIYFDSTEGAATALLFNYAAALSETMQEPWRGAVAEFELFECILFTYSVVRHFLD